MGPHHGTALGLVERGKMIKVEEECKSLQADSVKLGPVSPGQS